MPANETPATSAPETATDAAVAASERLLDVSRKVGIAYADAYQEAVMGLADLREKMAEAVPPVDWRTFVPPAGVVTPNPMGARVREAADQAGQANAQLADARKRLGLSCVEAYEQTALSLVDLRERVAASTNAEWMRTYAATRARLEREFTRACASFARRALD